jgi:hypothetical protein
MFNKNYTKNYLASFIITGDQLCQQQSFKSVMVLNPRKTEIKPSAVCGQRVASFPTSISVFTCQLTYDQCYTLITPQLCDRPDQPASYNNLVPYLGITSNE